MLCVGAWPRTGPSGSLVRPRGSTALGCGARPSRPVTDLIPGDPTARCPQGIGREAGEGKAGERKTPAYFVSEMVNTDPKESVSVPLNS